MNKFYKLAQKISLEEMQSFLQKDEKELLDFVSSDLSVIELLYYAYIGLESELNKIE